MQKEEYFARGSLCSSRFVGYSQARYPMVDQQSPSLIQPCSIAILSVPKLQHPFMGEVKVQMLHSLNPTLDIAGKRMRRDVN